MERNSQIATLSNRYVKAYTADVSSILVLSSMTARSYADN